MPERSTAGVRRTKATMGWRRKSSSPTSTLDASAPMGIFFMKCSSACARQELSGHAAAKFARAYLALEARESSERLTLLKSIAVVSWFIPFLASAVVGEG